MNTPADTRAEPDQPLHFTVWNLLEPAAMLYLARMMLLLVPFRWICVGLGLTPRQADLRQPSPSIARITGRMRSRLTYISSNYPALGACVPQSVAAAVMLRLRGIRSTLHFGVLRTASPEEPLRAHAWLTVGKLVVTGDGTRIAFNELNPHAANVGSPRFQLPREGSQ